MGFPLILCQTEEKAVRDWAFSSFSLLSKMMNELSGCSVEIGVAVTFKCLGTMRGFSRSLLANISDPF